MNGTNNNDFYWTNIGFNKNVCFFYNTVLFFIKMKINFFFMFFKIFTDRFVFFKKTTLSIFQISNNGKFNFFYAKVDAKGNIISEVNKVEVKPKAFITHKAFEAHSFQLIGKAGIILAFACGVRGGLSYEKDTFRLNQPMHSLK